MDIDLSEYGYPNKETASADNPEKPKTNGTVPIPKPPLPPVEDFIERRRGL